MFNAEHYSQQLRDLLPEGPLWDSLKRLSSRFNGLVQAHAEELARIDNRISNLPREANPATALELLPDWEEFAGLPGCALSAPETVQERRAAAAEKITYDGDDSPAAIKALAATLGYDIEIIQYTPFITGISKTGDNLNPLEFRFIWRVQVNGPRATPFRTGVSLTGEKLLTIARAEDLECLLKEINPAHTKLFFEYQGV
ncbi:MAG: putative phage tail protein [Candidatus Sedimenticola sp. (ex Thyasira tokunagai)]